MTTQSAETLEQAAPAETIFQPVPQQQEMPRADRDFSVVHAHVEDKSVVRLPPPVDMRELLLALKDVLTRAELKGHHAIQREALSVRNRMSDVLKFLGDGGFHAFEKLFNP